MIERTATHEVVSQALRAMRQQCESAGCTKPLIIMEASGGVAVAWVVQHGQNPEHAMTIDRLSASSTEAMLENILSWLDRVHAPSALETSET